MKEPTSEDKKQQDLLKKSGEIPSHVAIIMDGNGRWAQEKHKHRTFGHREGVKSVRDTVEASGQLGIKYLTLYTFSTENWKRPKSEVTVLMRLLIKALKDETDNLHENNVRLQAVGNLDTLPTRVLQELMDAIEKTKNNKGLTLVLALSYSGRWDIINAITDILTEHRGTNLRSEEINEKLLK